MMRLLIFLEKITNQPKKIKYIPFNIDPDFFTTIKTERSNEIVYIGNIGTAQNLSALIKAMKIVLEEFPDLKLQVYGGGDQEKEIKNLVKLQKLENSIRFNVPVLREKIPSILCASLIGIVPLKENESLKYAIPTKTFEYFACGLPVLAYGSSKELENIMINASAGVYVKGNDPKKIAQGIIMMLKDEPKLKKYSINGRNFVLQRSKLFPSIYKLFNEDF